MRVYDVTVPISEVMPVWPGTPPVRIEKRLSIDRGDPANVSHISLGCHTGTHVDAPYHFVQHGSTVDDLPLEVLMGPAFVAEIDGIEGNTIEVYDLACLHFPQDTQRLLIKTTNSHFWEDRLSEFETDYVHLSYKTAEWLVKRGIRLVGVDYLSVEAFGSARHRVHLALLNAGIIIVEGLNLSRVPGGWCRFVCLPLKLEGCDGAPARALVMRD